MAKIAEALYTYLEGTEITISTGKAYLLAVPFHFEAFLSKLLCQQVAAASPYLGGTAVAYKVDMLNSNVGLTPGEIDPATLPVSWPMYRILNQQSALATAQVAAFIPSGNAYRNVDGDQTINERYVYVLIQPTAAGTTTKWEMAITAYTTHGAT